MLFLALSNVLLEIGSPLISKSVSPRKILEKEGEPKRTMKILNSGVKPKPNHEVF